MKKTINLPQDELPHPKQAIEWWYWNGQLKSKTRDYAFMSCLFKADTKKINLKFLKIPIPTIYFSHTIAIDLKSKTIKKEILPAVIVSADSFKRSKLFVNYFYPAKTSFINYEIRRVNKNTRLKTGFFDLNLKDEKPMLLTGSGFINLGKKSTYYYSLPRLKATGIFDGEEVTGQAWHDHQWSQNGFMKDSWLWFSIQTKDGTDIVAFDYKGFKQATVSLPDGQQKIMPVKFTPTGQSWKSPKTEISYQLNWLINIGDEYEIKLKPKIKNCEINFGSINYWEGPMMTSVNDQSANGFMEYLSNQETSLFDFLKDVEKSFLKKFNIL
jgi:predicted secreted hydrolase